MVAKLKKSHVPKKFKVKTGDKVIVVSGKSKGSIGDVKKIITDKNRAIVSGVNLVKKHKKSEGIIEKESSINISNIALVDPATGKPTRVGFKFLEDGTKVRFAKKSGEIIK